MQARLVARNIIAACLSLVPQGWLDRIRHLHAESAEGSLTRKTSRSLLKVVRYRLIDSTRETISPADRPDIRFKNVDSVIARRMYWFGQDGYEGAESRWWERCCAEATEILEIGANIGFYTVLGAKAAGDTPYTAVEPHPVTHGILRQNVKLNDLRNVRLVEAAVVGKRTTDTMTMLVPDADPDQTPAGAYLRDAPDVYARTGGREVTVDVVVASKLIGKADLIKLDVEGYEHHILLAIQAHIEKRKPTIFVEVLDNTPELRSLLGRWCNELGYQPQLATNDGTRTIPVEDLLTANLARKYGTRDVILKVE